MNPLQAGLSQPLTNDGHRTLGAWQACEVEGCERRGFPVGSTIDREYLCLHHQRGRRCASPAPMSQGDWVAGWREGGTWTTKEE